MAYPSGEKIEWNGEDPSELEEAAVNEALAKLKPWEKAWLDGYIYATSPHGRRCIDSYLRKRIRKLMEA